MSKKRYMPEEIIQHLRTVELETGKGPAVFDAYQSDTCWRALMFATTIVRRLPHDMVVP